MMPPRVWPSRTAGGSPPATSNNKVDISYDKWFTPRDRAREDKVLYFSEVGDPCPRRLWYKYNTPTVGVKPDGRALLKFFYGDMLEELVLNVAEDAGHKVEKKQEKAILEGVGACQVKYEQPRPEKGKSSFMGKTVHVGFRKA